MRQPLHQARKSHSFVQRLHASNRDKRNLAATQIYKGRCCRPLHRNPRNLMSHASFTSSHRGAGR
jgi:hypothetical protein